jgi:rhodanese-related sulfurtransferase
MLKNILKILGASFLVGSAALLVHNKPLFYRLRANENIEIINKVGNKNKRFFTVVSLAEAIQLKQNLRNIFIDVRNNSQYNYSRIPGALNIPFEDIEMVSGELLKKLHSAPNIILYCLSATCDTAEASAVILYRKGFRNLKVYTGGWGEWKKCRLPFEGEAMDLSGVKSE